MDRAHERIHWSSGPTKYKCQDFVPRWSAHVMRRSRIRAEHAIPKRAAHPVAAELHLDDKDSAAVRSVAGRLPAQPTDAPLAAVAFAITAPGSHPVGAAFGPGAAGPATAKARSRRGGGVRGVTGPVCRPGGAQPPQDVSSQRTCGRQSAVVTDDGRAGCACWATPMNPNATRAVTAAQNRTRRAQIRRFITKSPVLVLRCPFVVLRALFSRGGPARLPQ